MQASALIANAIDTVTAPFRRVTDPLRIAMGQAAGALQDGQVNVGSLAVAAPLPFDASVSFQGALEHAGALSTTPP